MLQRRLLAIVAAGGLAVAAPVALAASKNGLTPVAPKAGATLPVGKSPTFKVRSSGDGTVWLHICKSAKKNAKGVICYQGKNGGTIAQMRKKGGVYQVTPKFFDYPGFWANRAGTWYWQAHRIACENGDTSDCLQEGPVVKIRLR